MTTFKYEPSFYRFSRQAQPDSIPVDRPAHSEHEVHSCILPLIRNGQCYGVNQILGHPRIKLAITTELRDPTPLNALPESIVGDRVGKPVIRTAAHVAFYVARGSDPCRVFERKYAEHVDSLPDVTVAWQVYEEAQAELQTAEQENLAFFKGIPEYVQAAELLKAERADIEALKNQRNRKPYQDHLQKAKQLEAQIDRIKETHQPPHVIGRCKRNVDEAWRNLERTRNGHWRAEELESHVRAYFHSRKVMINQKVTVMIARALQGSGRRCAIYELGSRDESVQVDSAGLPGDVSASPITVSLDAIIEALQPTKTNTWHKSRRHGSRRHGGGNWFAYFPIQSQNATDGTFIDHVDKNVGDGIVGIQYDNEFIIIVLRKVLLVDVLMSEEYYRLCGVVDALMNVAGEILKYSHSDKKTHETAAHEQAGAAEAHKGTEPGVVTATVETEAPEEGAEADTGGTEPAKEASVGACQLEDAAAPDAAP